MACLDRRTEGKEALAGCDRQRARWPASRDPQTGAQIARRNLTTLVELRDVLDEQHLVEIMERAAGRTEDQVKELVAVLRRQPAPPDLQAPNSTK
jgi:hypothetical protein